MSKVTVNVSNRHIHLTKEHVELLFGKGYELTKLRVLTQAAEFACNETLTIAGQKGEIENVRIIGPVRKSTQVEITVSDSYKLGVTPPLRLSGDLAGSEEIVLQSKSAKVKAEECCIIAKRHVHISLEDSKDLNIKDGDLIALKTTGERSVIFENVIARVDKKITGIECHLDIEEANAALVKNGDKAEIIK